MDAFTLTQDLKILALIGCGVEQSRKPDQRDGDTPSVREKYR
jgi:hypothetical protein